MANPIYQWAAEKLGGLFDSTPAPVTKIEEQPSMARAVRPQVASVVQPQATVQAPTQPAAATTPGLQASMPSILQAYGAEPMEKPPLWQNLLSHFSEGLLTTAAPTIAGGIGGGRQGAAAGAMRGMERYDTQQAKEAEHKMALKEKVMGNKDLVGAYWRTMAKNPKDITDFEQKLGNELSSADKFGTSPMGNLIRMHIAQGDDPATAIAKANDEFYQQQQTLRAIGAGGAAAAKGMPYEQSVLERDTYIDPSSGEELPRSPRTGKPIVQSGQAMEKVKTKTTRSGRAGTVTPTSKRTVLQFDAQGNPIR